MTSHSSNTIVLAGDVGGTKTNLGLFQRAEVRPVPIAVEAYSSHSAPELEDLVAKFLAVHPVDVSAACFGIAGPVIDGTARTTNLPWFVSEQAIRDRFTWSKVRLINDLVATARSVTVLQKHELYAVNEGEARAGGAIGIMAPGTGLGVALMAFHNGRAMPLSSEGGHADFAPRSPVEIDLLRHLLEKMPHVSVERVASGPGLFTIYSWLKEYRGNEEPLWLSERLSAEDPSAVVSQVGLAGKDPVCGEALGVFVSIIGAAAGNLALTGMTTGGMYLGGGICPKILPKLDEETFMAAFTAKGRFSDLLRTIPVKVILNDKAALLGAACCALEI